MAIVVFDRSNLHECKVCMCVVPRDIPSYTSIAVIVKELGFAIKQLVHLFQSFITYHIYHMKLFECNEHLVCTLDNDGSHSSEYVPYAFPDIYGLNIILLNRSWRHNW